MPITCCYIKEQYFADNAHYEKMLDSGNAVKQAQRTHLCIQVTTNDNTFYIPLRNNLGADVRRFGRIGHSVPSHDRPNAGLDYRYALIVNDPSFIEIPTSRRIPRSQHQKITTDITTIQNEFEQYLLGFIKTANKNVSSENLFIENRLLLIS